MSAPSWDFSFVYQSLQDPEINNDLLLSKQNLDALAHLSIDNVEDCQRALSLYDDIHILIQSVSNYAACQSAVDATNEAAKALVIKTDVMQSTLTQAFSPFESQLAGCDPVFFDAVMSGNDETGSYDRHAFRFSRMRQHRVYRLSVPEEQLLAATQVDGRNAWGRLYDAITGTTKVMLTFPDGSEETMGLSQAASLLYGGDTYRREPAWRAIHQAMEKQEITFAAILNALAGGRLAEYEKRSHTKPLHFLSPALEESRIEQKTLEAMMGVTEKHKALSRRAAKSMAKMFGNDTLAPWDEMAAMPSLEAKVSTNYTFEQAIVIIRRAFDSVNPEMAEFVDMMVEQRLIDAAPQPNKVMGAFCTKIAKTRTPLVFMSYGGSMSDVLTLAHELGHAFHNWVMKDMPMVETDYPMTLAETASIFAENVVRDALLEEAESDSDKLLMLWEEAQTAVALMLNIPVRFEFERAFYQQRLEGELTPRQLRNLMSDTWKQWYGDAMSEPNDLFWASKLHFSIAEISFYNYPYLFGYLFSTGVYAQRNSKGERFYEDYKSLLKDTGRMSAEEVALKHLGANLEQPDFWQQSISIAEKRIEAFEALVDKTVVKR
ncbi:M3 family oligoendopeptidase [Enterovibrio sp. ZSDZ42]|uniref:M3 family oligoendopeptidase n=1 Tax=Enterovibrio gelatinilyticus TaxID=2899819 RepID=A0ABT5R134_9GAMM|nr:M3 family oligoendopeptidase [Enterovibrio sp. ZSDZ42]MDD1793984.1 M3 family oligoendopeptidase [Enterovibrio sp. ZSDZ42]